MQYLFMGSLIIQNWGGTVTQTEVFELSVN